eukprot:scaffold1803_cov195-Alexandrium_tamarense.AAC.3
MVDATWRRARSSPVTLTNLRSSRFRQQPTNITGRWVEWEIKRDYPGNAHLTQAMASIWRPAKYVGCGESAKEHKNGQCRIQVCRYARAGNCDMGRYNATAPGSKNWLPPMLADTSSCGPIW